MNPPTVEYPNDVLTVDQAAEFLQLNEYTVRLLARRRELPGKKVGGSWRFSRKKLLEFVEKG